MPLLPDRTGEIRKVWEQLHPHFAPSVDAIAIADQPAIADDEAVIARARNSAKFETLWNGNWSEYPSQSEADFALINLIANQTRNREQIARLFRRSGLGQRDKADRDNYVHPMIDKAMTPMPHETYGVNLSNFRNRDGVLVFPAQQLAQTAAPVAPVPAPSPRASTFYSAASLKGKAVPPREWIVPGLVPNKTVTLFSGDGGTGKSLLALQLAVAGATGREWLGNTVYGGRVLFISAEDDNDELHRRLDDILRSEGLDYDALTGLTLRSLAGEDALLAIETKLALVQSELFREVDARVAADAPSLVIIDTLADAYPANENDRAKVRQFVGFLRGLALSRGCAVMVLSHPSLTGMTSGTGLSGSTAWNNSVRSRLYLSRITDKDYEPDPDARVLSTKKANYGRTGGEIILHWQNGVFVTTNGPVGDAQSVNAKAERVFMHMLDLLASQGRKVSPNPGPTYAPSQFAKHREAEGCKAQVLKDAMDALLSRGDIVAVEHGTHRKGMHLERKQETGTWS